MLTKSYKKLKLEEFKCSCGSSISKIENKYYNTFYWKWLSKIHFKCNSKLEIYGDVLYCFQSKACIITNNKLFADSVLSLPTKEDIEIKMQTSTIKVSSDFFTICKDYYNELEMYFTCQSRI